MKTELTKVISEICDTPPSHYTDVAWLVREPRFLPALVQRRIDDGTSDDTRGYTQEERDASVQELLKAWAERKANRK